MNPLDIMVMFCSIATGNTCNIDIDEGIREQHLLVMQVQQHHTTEESKCYDVVINYNTKEVAYNLCEANMLRTLGLR